MGFLFLVIGSVLYFGSSIIPMPFYLQMILNFIGICLIIAGGAFDTGRDTKISLQIITIIIGVITFIVSYVLWPIGMIVGWIVLVGVMSLLPLLYRKKVKKGAIYF